MKTSPQKPHRNLVTSVAVINVRSNCSPCSGHSISLLTYWKLGHLKPETCLTQLINSKHKSDIQNLRPYFPNNEQFKHEQTTNKL
jgi:hypothetical protein